MPIKFKVVEKGQPGVVGGGIKKFYAATVRNSELSLEQLTTSIEKISTVSGADIRAVLYALVDVAVESLSDSNIVRLGDLGSIMVNVKSEGRDTAEEVTSSAIKGTSVIFRPGSRIKEMQATAKFQKA
jgi:predicted histone-like DNA-binding protein